MTQAKPRSETSIYGAVAEFKSPTLRQSIWQIVNSTLPYLALLVAMYWSLGISYWLTLALAIPASGFLVRVFIIFHDCGHGSFFRSRRANSVVGFVSGLLFFLPYHYWTQQHAVHHATAGDLDHRGSGDIHTLTVREYLELSPVKKLLYRAYRHPFTLLVLGPTFVFLVRYRFWVASDDMRRRRSAIITNLALAAIVTAATLTIGIQKYLMIQVPIMLLAGAAGVWLFYVQHQFEGTYWEHHESWSHLRGAMEGSSFYNLPAVLRWFSGNIGFHHVHHISPRIPNYRLKACLEAIPELQKARAISLRESIKTLRCHLWDEERRRIISFADLAV